MKKLVWFLAGIGSAAVLAQFASWRRGRTTMQGAASLDLNDCSREELLQALEINDELAERILDNRPYRSKYDLLNRLIVPETVFSRVRSKVYVEPAAARRSVQIALA